ncbi:hypothetical protein KY325_01565 [Candidatus Woesearchaeota archaeon]|nr:hypothetical protein [Candidatus Woesearchaeota archaeon]MBW3017826.1 hypothetical protein [Candidatus Woesearchaeota archaeon]
MKDGYFDRYEANGFDTSFYIEGGGLRISRLDTATNRESTLNLSFPSLEQVTFILLKYFDVESNESETDNPWEFNPRQPFPWYLHPNLVDFRSLVDSDSKNRGYPTLPAEFSFRSELKPVYRIVDDNKRVEIDFDNNVYIVSGNSKMIFHWSEISRLLRAIQEFPPAKNGSLLPVFEKWEKERVSVQRFDEEKAGKIERGKGDFMPPGTCLCLYNDDMGLSRSCFNTIIDRGCSKENSCMYCYDSRNNHKIPAMYNFVRDHAAAGLSIRKGMFKDRKHFVEVRTGKVCEPSHIIIRPRFIHMLESTGSNVNIYRIVTTKNLGIDNIVAANLEPWNSVVQFSLSDTPFARIERGANYWCCGNEERIKAARWYKEQGKNIVFRLVWDITGEKSDFVRHVDSVSEEFGIPVLHTPPRFGSSWLSEITIGKTWDQLLDERRYIHTLNSNGTPGDLTPRTSAINPELRAQLGDNAGKLHRMCAKTRDSVVESDQKLANLAGTRDQYLYWCGKCFTGIKGAIYDKAFSEKSAMEKLSKEKAKAKNGKGKKSEWKKKWNK